MAMGEIEVVIRCGESDPAYSAAHAVAQALAAEGAYVDMRSVFRMDAPEASVLRGARVRVRVDGENTFKIGNGGAGKTLEAASTARSESVLARLAKVVIGIVLLLMVFGTELRLHFGMKFGTFVTLVAICVFWRFALRRSPPVDL